MFSHQAGENNLERVHIVYLEGPRGSKATTSSARGASGVDPGRRLSGFVSARQKARAWRRFPLQQDLQLQTQSLRTRWSATGLEEDFRHTPIRWRTEECLLLP